MAHEEGGGLLLNITRSSDPTPHKQVNAKARRAGKKVVRNRRWDRERVNKREEAKKQGKVRYGDTYKNYIKEKDGSGTSRSNPQPGEGYRKQRSANSMPLGQRRGNNYDADNNNTDDYTDIVAEALHLAKTKEQKLAATLQADGIVEREDGGVEPELLPEDAGRGKGTSNRDFYPAPCATGPPPNSTKRSNNKRSYTESAGTVDFTSPTPSHSQQHRPLSTQASEDPFYVAARALQGFDAQKEMREEEEGKANDTTTRPKKKHRGSKHDKESAPAPPTTAQVARVPLGKVVRPSALFGDEMYADIGLDPRLVKALEEQAITKVTKIQALTIPPLLGGSDAMIKSITGSGKTLSFVVPMLQRLVQIRTSRADGTLALIIGPTRELCQQLANVTQSLAKPFPWLVTGTLIGGDQRKHEKARLRKGVSIVVGSPGRLLDHLQNTQSWSLSNLRWLILDEADRLLDLGFESQLLDILKILGERQSIQIKRQNVLVSATLNSKIEKLQKFALADSALTLGFKAGGEARRGREGKRPRKDSDASDNGSVDDTSSSSSSSGDDDKFVLPTSLSQQFMVTDIKDKLLHLCAFLRWKSEQHKIIVFFASCDSVDFHASLLPKATFKGKRATVDDLDGGKRGGNKKAGKGGDGGGGGGNATEDKQGEDFSDDPKLLNVPVFKLHGNIPQAERTKSIAAFRKSPHGILMCSDVAARGLDIHDVDWIIQYEVPGDPSEYVHRIGRTARLGREGHALLFLTASETEYIAQLRARGADVKPLNAETVLKTLAPHIKDTGLAAARLQSRLEFAVEKDRELGQTAGLAFQSTIRAYTAQPRSLKSIFNLTNVHLGHLAKAFALKQTPSKIAAQQLKVRRKAEAEAKHKKQQKKIRKQYQNANPHRNAADEFAA